ncbi:MAG: hypothetical protein JRJ86_14115 [Deltaproteobacteria bacterium]|nr:hypothetical protein [Deltaproteobacteria bacterium]
MADLTDEFKTFHDRVTLTSGKKESLRKARNAIRSRIRNYFHENLKLKLPKFLGQGSYAMGTTVNPIDGEFDIDDGIYLQHLDENDNSKWPSPGTVHSWLINATDGHTKDKPIDKRTCVRMRYAGQYHVDLPAYAKLNGDYLLAEKGNKGWHRSDPLAINMWFMENVKAHGVQLSRVVRYLKAWADFQSGRRGIMPSGLLLTVLAGQNLRIDEREDVSLSDTAYAISNMVYPVFCVYNPVDSEEELTARLTDEQKIRFQEAISDLASEAALAIRTDDREEASKLWRKQLGDRFPASEKAVHISQQQKDVAKLSTVYVAKNPPKPWGATRNESMV